MRIQESDIRLSSRHERDFKHEIETRGERSFRAVFSEAAALGKSESMGERERMMRMLQSLVEAMLAALDGKKCRSEIADGSVLPQTDKPMPPARQVEWRWEMTERIEEHERTRVEGGGIVKTTDGKAIDFSVSLEMCRDYSCERQYVETGTVTLHDPLVVNFDGTAAELGQDRFSFDLDADGRVELIPELGAGSGFLVLDRNGNGKVDDGKELFGAFTGDGFAELAALDEDGNGWLDEADAGFGKLAVWQKGEELAGLQEEGIGALWLGSVDSQFAIKDDANRLLGEIRASGLYLREDGQAGSLQQVDLAIEAKKMS